MLALCAQILFVKRIFILIKQIFSLCLLALVLAVLAYNADISDDKILVSHSDKSEPIEVLTPNKYICYESRTLIADNNDTAQAIMPNGDIYFFNDITNSFIWYMAQKSKDKIKLYVYSRDTNRYILAQNAWYSRVDITPMGYGIGAYEFHTYGINDNYFKEVLLYAARGETLINPYINILLSENRI